ncbi:MAG: beta-N-acetylhexosaminidase [Anaerolineae bacterium]|nr:beta-N-acetylhexosaminidase [Anaerolineae bacterium]
MSTLSIEEKVGQMLGVGFQGLAAPDYLLDWLAAGRVGVIILFARNVESPEQLARLTQSIHQAAKYPVLIGIDQEGGMVARLREGFTESPGAMALASARNAEALTERVDHMLAVEMQAMGINWNFAPAVDITYNTANPTVSTRSFGSDAEHVGQMAASAVKGFQRGGVAACAKHFPGLGDTSVDTHLELARLNVSVEHILHFDLIPFRAAMDAGLASVMTTHTIFSALDTQHPATLSPVIVKRLLREELGFRGVVASDCMEMKAISDHYGAGESAVLAALAGIDLILFSHTRSRQEAAYEALLNAVQTGRVPMEVIDAANERIADLKRAYPAQTPDVKRIRDNAHLEVAQEAARAGTVMLANEGILPLPQERVGLVEFASYMETEVMEKGEQTSFAKRVIERFPQIKLITLQPDANTREVVEEALELARTVDVLVIATRSAHLNLEQLEAARGLLVAASRSVLVCLRNPYDAGVLAEAKTIICTSSDSPPSLQAAVDVLAGEFVPNGKLPVTVMTHA